ncbi:MAG: crossover junction endodeoxyribonuclease RuvC [Candidatus Tectomicrobia bacterium]|nr:crossover junction endodeoxyribonuclease RuvC [Candidatus Tectomicrobia bacterium]
MPEVQAVAAAAVVRIIGIDPGSKRVGVGVIDASHDYVKHLFHATHVLDEEKTFPVRLVQLGELIDEALRNWMPTMVEAEFGMVAALEAPVFRMATPTIFPVVEARGVILQSLGRVGVAVAEYQPQTVKLRVTGYGRARKPQVKAAVRDILGLPKKPQEDAADALAVAICHAVVSGLVGREIIERVRVSAVS